MLYPTSSIELPERGARRSSIGEDVLPAHGEGREAPQVPHLVVCSNERGHGRLPRRFEIKQGPPGQLLLEAVSQTIVGSGHASAAL